MVSTIGTMLMFIGKGVIMVVSGWIGYLIIMNAEPLKDKIYSPIFPVIIIVFIAYLLASVFLSVFSFSATTILHCFIIDQELSAK
jgi:choline transporter-like protein 2/4/5